MTVVKSDYEIAGTEVEIHAYATGRWEVLRPGQGSAHERVLGGGDTMEKAIAAARHSLARTKVKVTVPFVTRDGRRGHAYSIHAKSRKPMVAIGDQRIQWDSYRDPFKSNIPQEALDRYLALAEQAQAIRREMGKIEDEWTLELGRATREAVEQAAREAVTKEEVG